MSVPIASPNKDRSASLDVLMRIILEVLEGPRKGRTFVLDRHDAFIVGRSRLVHCPLPEDSALSRDHFLIELGPPGCELRDLGSTNGTFVNDERVDRARLVAGDTIAAGQSLFLVRMEEPAGPPLIKPPPPPTDEFDRSKLAIPSQKMIQCGGCGIAAPPGIDVAGAGASGGFGSIYWLCDQCRAEVAMTPQPVPHYTTIRELGRGAMGVVYLAQHNRTGGKVALKLIVPESAAARSAIDRFLREMSVISQLKHPNIIEWFEQGIDAGRFWFAMEYIEGNNLEALALSKPGQYPIRSACRLASQILKGLDYAHGQGFVHRDIKPENILIGRNPEGLLTAKISDFGLAKSYRGIGLSGLTHSGEIRGTIPFMPPEQMIDFAKVLPSADLYSTAATLYYLITGQFIYDQITGEGADPIRLLLEESPVPIRQRRPDVPAALAEVLHHCLDRDPEKRYPDAAAMRQVLRPFC
ncbi:hypothetical protein BH23PLA1_BH23PLA1_08490 [soil metagenome]